MKKLPPQNILKANFDYDPKTGHLIRKAQKYTNKKLIGRPAGCVRPDGYVVVSVENKLYLAHRIIWCMLNTEIDDSLYIDHIDGNRSNNRLENLRQLTHQENLRAYNEAKNRKDYGIWWRKDINKWRAEVRLNGKRMFLGHHVKRVDAKTTVINFLESQT